MQNVAFYTPNLSCTNDSVGGYSALNYAALQCNPSAMTTDIKQSEVEVYPNVQAFFGSDVYVAKQGVVVGHNEKRYIRLRWGDGTKGNKARWVGFAPSDWKRERPLDADPELLGFYIKPNLCDRTNKQKANVGWVTLSIDCDRRAVKATIDGWTLGKVFIPTWLIGRVMRPVAIAETNCPVEFNLRTEEGCEKVIRSGFKKWATIRNTQLELLKCQHLHTNFEHNESPDRHRILSVRSEILGLQLHVDFDEESNVKGIVDCDEGYISYEAVDMDFTKPGHEVLPLVINDRHAYRVKLQGLWDLFWQGGKSPLDYLSERITALVRTIFEAKMRYDMRLYKNATTKLSHLRHILFFLAKDSAVVEDANIRVEWFTSNTDSSGTHRNFTPDLGRLLVCLSVSDYQWEDVAIPFFTEALHRALPAAIEKNPRLIWHGENKSSVEEMLEALLITDRALSETILQVQILNKILKPHHTDLDNLCVDRLSAEEICCSLSGLGDEFQILEYVQPSKKDEIKKCMIKREWEEEFKEEQWKKIEAALDNKPRFRGLVARSRMVAECHGTGGLPNDKWFNVIDYAIELTKTLEGFDELLEAFSLEYPGDEQMQHILTESVAMSQQKGYIPSKPVVAFSEGIPSARRILKLNNSSSDKLGRQGSEIPIFDAEVLPKPEPQEERIVGEDSQSATEPTMANINPAVDGVGARPPLVGEPSHMESNQSEGREQQTAAQIMAGAYQQSTMNPNLPYSKGVSTVTPGFTTSPTPPTNMGAYQQQTTLRNLTAPGYNSPTPPNMMMQPSMNVRQVSNSSVQSVGSNYSLGYPGDNPLMQNLNEHDKALLRVPQHPQTIYVIPPPQTNEVSRPYLVQYVVSF